MDAKLMKEDARGRFYNILGQNELKVMGKNIPSDIVWKEMNYVETKKGVKRGGHYHKKMLELFFIIEGSVRVEMRNVKTNDQAGYVLNKFDVAVMPTGWEHTIIAVEDTKWVSLNSELFDEKSPDMFTSDKQ